MTSIPMPVSEPAMASGLHKPLASHPSKRFRVSRSNSRSRLSTRALSGIRRRPDSVFSRRGTDTPVQLVAPFSLPTSTPTYTIATPSPRGSSKRWKMGRSQQQVPKGCILRAVPQAAHEPALPSPIANASGSPIHSRAAPDPLSHARVDATMATSPNDEILSNIGQFSLPLSTPPYYPPPSLYSPTVSPNSPRKKNKKGRKSEGDAGCIGFWKDGKAYWEAEVASMPSVPQPQNTFIAELDSRPIKLETPARELPPTQKDKRPRIQVVIPNDLKNRAPHARPPFVSQAVQHSSAGEIISSRDVSPPLASGSIAVRNSAVSPLAHQIITQRQQTVPIYLDEVAEMPVSATVSKHPSFSSSSGASNSENDDAKSSNYNESNRTSWTSVDDNLEPCLRQNPNLLNYDARTASKAYSIISPAAAGIFDDSTPVVTTSQPATPVSATSLHQLNKDPKRDLNKDKPLPPEPQIPSIQQTIAKLRNHASSPTLSARNSVVSRKNSRRNPRMSLPARGQATDNGSVPHSGPPSPTLSEAETALEEHLSSITEQSPFEWDDMLGARGLGSQRMSSYSSARAPTPPRKSSRRKRVTSMPVAGSSNHIATQQHNQKKGSARSQHKQKKQHPRRAPSQRVIEPDAAEKVIFSIFERLQALDDLFSLSRVNRGFYRVFKRHELSLMRCVLKTQSPPAWEHREVSPPYPDGAEHPNPDSALPQPEYTPTTFYRHHMRDTYIITALKSLVLTRCQSFLRPETVMALASSGAARAARVDNAFWRIWTFCKIFGCNKGREDDIVGQMDWLRGGPLVHQTGIRATIMTSDSFDASNALLNAPDHFAKGNGDDGLSAEELYDMTEIWTCMGVLISGLEGRTEQAREFGVYEATDVRGGDIDGEENMLQEWVYYLTTLGLSVILELATASVNTDPSAFILALENGWMDWSPPEHEGSRRTFLKEAVARVYEEKIAAMASTTPQGDRAAMRQVMRQRIAAHKAEIRTRRRTGDCQLVRMSMERPMSEWEGVFSRLGGEGSGEGSDENLLLASPQPRRHPSNSSSVMAGAPTPCPPAPAPIARPQSELIALPPMPELPGVQPAQNTQLEQSSQRQSQHQMQERSPTGSNPPNPLLQTLAHAKQFDYGSPTEQHPALRSFLDSDSSGRRSSSSSDSESGVSPPSSSHGGAHTTRLFSEEAVHPAFRNASTAKANAPSSKKHTQHPRSPSNSSVSSVSAAGADARSAPSFVSAATSTTTPPTTAHGTPNLSISSASGIPLSPPPPPPPPVGVLPPSYSQAQQRHSSYQGPSPSPSHYRNHHPSYYQPHHHHSHSHPPAHPAYPFSTHPAAAHNSHQQQQQQQQHHYHRTAPVSPTSPTAFLPAHRRRVSTQHPLQQEMLGVASARGGDGGVSAATNTAEKAIFRIVEMGFTAEEAKTALMWTDPGDGLRVDRAVEWLLSR